MTAKRDLKRLVRDRQARTGERYTTAREKVLARGPRARVPVVELEDLTAEAARLGLKCKIHMFPDLARKIDVAAVLERLRGVLLATEADPAMELLRSVLLEGVAPPTPARSRVDGMEGLQRFLARAEAGIGGVSESGHLLALPVAGRRGVEMILCLVWAVPMPPIYRNMVVPRDPAVILARPSSLGGLALALPTRIP